MQENENILNEIEQRLNMLEKEKNEMENLYGIDEDIINDSSVIKSHFEKTTEIKNKFNSARIYENSNLPKLEIKKKEIKRIYKTPEILKDSLKYEPAINDLRSEKEFEPSFSFHHKIENNPYIPKGSSVNNYVRYLNEDYIQNYLN